jgi:hypothetical protein
MRQLEILLCGGYVMNTNVRTEVLTAMTMRNITFWIVMLRSPSKNMVTIYYTASHPEEEEYRS